MRRAVVESIGHYLPERVVENSEFEATLDTNDAWIRSRTGIERRHFAAEGETTSDMGIKAAQAALANAGCSVEDVDAIILATSTADLTFPSAANGGLKTTCSGLDHVVPPSVLNSTKQLSRTFAPVFLIRVFR